MRSTLTRRASEGERFTAFQHTGSRMSVRPRSRVGLVLRSDMSARHGLTLFEVLLSLALFLGTLAVLSQLWYGGVRASVGLIASIAGIAVGGITVAALGFQRTLIIGAVLQGFGVAAFALLAFTGPDLGVFSFAMAADNFCYAFAGVALVTYMSSLTSVGYTATQYALLSSIYTIFGKFLKGFSGAVVDGFQTSGRTLMESYALFYVGAGLIAIPALVLCVVLLARKPKEPVPAPI